MCYEINASSPKSKYQNASKSRKNRSCWRRTYHHATNVSPPTDFQKRISRDCSSYDIDYKHLECLILRALSWKSTAHLMGPDLRGLKQVKTKHLALSLPLPQYVTRGERLLHPN